MGWREKVHIWHLCDKHSNGSFLNTYLSRTNEILALRKFDMPTESAKLFIQAFHFWPYLHFDFQMMQCSAILRCKHIIVTVRNWLLQLRRNHYTWPNISLQIIYLIYQAYTFWIMIVVWIKERRHSKMNHTIRNNHWFSADLVENKSHWQGKEIEREVINVNMMTQKKNIALSSQRRTTISCAVVWWNFKTQFINNSKMNIFSFTVSLYKRACKHYTRKLVFATIVLR